jgi:hypothetical protein
MAVRRRRQTPIRRSGGQWQNARRASNPTSTSTGRSAAAATDLDLTTAEGERPTGRAEVRTAHGYAVHIGFTAWRARLGIGYTSNDGEPPSPAVAFLLAVAMSPVFVVPAVVCLLYAPGRSGTWPCYALLVLALLEVVGGWLLTRRGVRQRGAGTEITGRSHVTIKARPTGAAAEPAACAFDVTQLPVPEEPLDESPDEAIEVGDDPFLEAVDPAPVDVSDVR